MPYPVAHGLLGAVVVAALGEDAPRSKRGAQIAAGAFIGILPDFDFALRPYVMGEYGWHHGFSHSFCFAAIVGVLTALLIGSRTARMMLVFSLAIASHPALDYVLTEGIGVALFWPFTWTRYRLGTAGMFYQAIRSGETGGRFRFRLLLASLIEAAVFLPILVAVLWWRKRRAALANSKGITV